MRLAGSGGEGVGDAGGVGSGEVELGHGGAHEFGGFGDFHAVGRGEVECAVQAAGEDVRRAHAGLAKLVDRVGRVRGGVHGVGAGVDGGLAQQGHLVGAGSGVGLDGRHAGVEVGGHAYGGDAQCGGGDAGGGDSGGQELRLAARRLHGGGGLLGLGGHLGHAGGEFRRVREQADGDVAVQSACHGGLLILP